MFRHPIILFLIVFSLRLQAQEVEVSSLPFNSNYNEFSPVPYQNGVVYCSDRPSRFGIAWIDAEGNNPSKIYYNQNKSNSILAENIVTRLNEGPACFNREGTMMIFTGTARHGRRPSENKLGLFISQWSADGWSDPVPFEHNSPDSSYSIAHPSLSTDGKYLYFASDMKGGFGGKDVYVCENTGTSWTQPVNIGKEVNSSSDEIFPFIDSSGKLYFSSNRKETKDYDIYFSLSKAERFMSPVPMPEPINTTFDDFSLSLNQDNESGYFTSNRNGKNDDLFSFRVHYPEFENCPVAELPSFCYLFEETNIVPNDSTPMTFEWELGDGNTAAGLSTEYCFKDFGNYHVALNVYDSKTRVRFARVSEVDIQINRSPFPYITSIDTIESQIPFSLSAEGTDIENFQSDEYFWNFGDGARAKGYSVSHAYYQPGFYTVQIGINGKTSDGLLDKRCAVKIIAVGTAEQLAAISNGEEPITQMSVLQEDMAIVEIDTTQYLQPKPDSTVYFVEFKQSDVKLQPDDPYFSNIKYEITERFDSTDTAYRYSVGHTTEMPVMLRVYRDMMDNGYIESLVREEVQRNFKERTIQAWWYLPDSVQTSINSHINKFNDIRFDLGTYNIRPESFDNLNYISEVMNLEQSCRLIIKAHTDSVGTEKDNLVLAQRRADAVVTYLNEQGVKKTRLIPEGYGESMPAADNGNEEGRAQNRRVEFEMLFNEKMKRR